MPTIHERVDTLEDVLRRFIISTQRFQEESERDRKALHDEMRAFKDEMRVFKDEMRLYREESERDRKALHEEMKAFKDEMRLYREESERDRKALHEEMKAFKDEMRVFKDEMRVFKDEMKVFREEMREEDRKMNKRWGEISNKLGTIVEDIIYPALRPVIRQYFKCEPIHMAMNIRRCKGDVRDEFDAVVEREDMVFLVEVKATPKKEYIDDFKDNKVERFRGLFPEYEKKRLILIFASLRLEEGTVDYLTQNKIYAMAYREWEYMDILNFDAISHI